MMRLKRRRPANFFSISAGVPVGVVAAAAGAPAVAELTPPELLRGVLLLVGVVRLFVTLLSPVLSLWTVLSICRKYTQFVQLLQRFDRSICCL